MSMAKYKPHAYQRRAILRICNEPGLALFADPGTGKTSCVLKAVSLMAAKKPGFKCLVIAPLAVADSTWPAEVQKWPEFGIRLCRLTRGESVDKTAHIFVTTPDSFTARLGEVGDDISHFDLLVVDESTKFKNPLSKRFKALQKLRGFFRRCVILTGTPAPNGPMDLWSQLWLVDTGRALGDNFYSFRKRFFAEPSYGYEWKLKPNAELEINKNVEHMVARVSADEVLDLPSRSENRIDVILPPAVMAEHDKMRRSLAAYAATPNEVLKPSAGAAYGCCRQIAYGLTYDAERGTEQRRKATKRHDRKIQMLAEFADNLVTPLLVFSEYTEFFEMCRDSGIDAPILDGRTVPVRRAELIDLWNLDEIKILFAHPASVGHGLNLQGGNCRDILWVAPPDNLEFYDQGNARVHRQGVKHAVTVHVMVAVGTVDEIAFKRLHSKSDLQTAILEFFADKNTEENEKEKTK